MTKRVKTYRYKSIMYKMTYLTKNVKVGKLILIFLISKPVINLSNILA